MATGTSVCSAVLAEEISSWAKVKVSRDRGGGGGSLAGCE